MAVPTGPKLPHARKSIKCSTARRKKKACTHAHSQRSAPAFTVVVESGYKRTLAHPAIYATILALCAGPIVMATGYKMQQETVRQFMGDDVADRIGPVWGFNEKGELNNMWCRTPRLGGESTTAMEASPMPRPMPMPMSIPGGVLTRRASLCLCPYLCLCLHGHA